MCIDACDAIMLKVGKPKGLIRYVSESELQNLQVQGSATTAEIPTALGSDQVVVLEGTIDDILIEA